MIGLGLVTCGRRPYYEEARAAIEKHLPLDHFFVFEDGGEPYVPDSTGDGENHGVGFAKNALLRAMLDAGCDWLFLSEEDVVVDGPTAITGYIDAAEASGFGHLMFHAHGPANPGPVSVGPVITLWPNYVGAYCLYSRVALETCGLMDEVFYNAWEHVEHSLRLSAAGFSPPSFGGADATGSEGWLHEIPGGISNPSIHKDQRWYDAFEAGKRHWLEVQPATYHRVFG